MTTEPNDNDTLVSATYRESAQETTPPELDKAILRMAANPKTSGDREGFFNWMRPLTWVVTAGLVAAITFNIPQIDDVQRSPAPESVSPEPAAPATSIEEAFSAEDSDVVEEAEKMASMRDGADQPAPLSRTREERAKRADDAEKDQQDVSVASRAFGTDASVAADAVAQEMFLEKKEFERESSCEESRRQEAASWYECVLELRDSGRGEDADSEMLELLEQFPDFRPELLLNK